MSNQQSNQQPTQQWQQGQQQAQQQSQCRQQPQQTGYPPYSQQQVVQSGGKSIFTDGLATSDKVLYCLLGVFVPVIGMICLYFSTQNGYNGMVRDKAKWIIIGVVIAIVMNIVFSVFGVPFLPKQTVNIINPTCI